MKIKQFKNDEMSIYNRNIISLNSNLISGIIRIFFFIDKYLSFFDFSFKGHSKCFRERKNEKPSHNPNDSGRDPAINVQFSTKEYDIRRTNAANHACDARPPISQTSHTRREQFRNIHIEYGPKATQN